MNEWRVSFSGESPPLLPRPQGGPPIVAVDLILWHQLQKTILLAAVSSGCSLLIYNLTLFLPDLP